MESPVSLLNSSVQGVRRNVSGRMLSQAGGDGFPSITGGTGMTEHSDRHPLGMEPHLSGGTVPYEAGMSTASKSGSFTYHRIVVDGDEGDKDYLRCAEIIASLVRARQVYKGMDKGQVELSAANAEALLQNWSLQDYTIDAGAAPRTKASFVMKDARGNRAAGEAHQLDGATLNPMGDAGDDDDGGSAQTGPPSPPVLSFKQGVYHLTGLRTAAVPWETYVKDVCATYGAIENGPCLSTARMRLTSLSEKFQLYLLLNSELERTLDPHRMSGSIYARCTHVDNLISMKTSVPAPVFLDFIANTAVEHPNTPLYVEERTGEVVRIMEYLAQGGVANPNDLTVEGLGLHPTLYRNKYLPYDMFNEQLNPAGSFGARLMQAVLSTNGPNEGDLCGSLVRPEMEQREFKKQQVVMTEMSLEIYGHNMDELETVATWVHRQGFNSFKRNIWTLTIPRHNPPTGPNSLPTRCETIGDQLRHLFYPMVMATLYPRDPQWVHVAHLLQRTGAISIQTSKVTRVKNISFEVVDPDKIPYAVGCSDYYFFYYVWANMVVLNALRARVGLNTFNFNPAVHEPTSAYDQLVASFLLADVAYHVSSLQKSWIMQYLYMYCRIGIVVSPLRDNALSTPYFEHPIIRYFQQGLLVSLSTSDPMHFHHRVDQPLLEEYATLMKLHSLTGMDMCELARNSVLNSNFPLEDKKKILGEHFSSLGSTGNDISLSNVCDYRLQYRHECLLHEETLLNLVLAQVAPKGAPATTVSLVPFSHSVQVPERVQQSRNARRMNYTDMRIVYPRIDICDGYTEKPATEAVETLRQVICLKKRYDNLRVVDVQVEDVFIQSDFDESIWEYSSYYGVVLLSQIGKAPTWPPFIPQVKEFIYDLSTVRKAVSSTPLRLFALHRLRLLEKKFLLHLSMNISKEAGSKEEKEWNNRDFFTTPKVDTNVQTDAGMNARTLLEYFVDKAQHDGDDVVFEEDNAPVTLRQLLNRYRIDVAVITVDELNHLIDTHADLRNIFLSPTNFMKGRYFAELTKRTLRMYQEDEYNFAEYRLTITGASEREWFELAHWFDRYGMTSAQSRWMISIPRDYRRRRREGKVRNFGDFLDHVFKPLWEISLHPAKDNKFHYFLTHVSGFDCIGDDSKIDPPLTGIPPHDWNGEENPPYNLYLYYIWANIASLNEFRASRGLCTFTFRPQCGEQGGSEHLIGGFLLANGINHGVTLAKHPVLEYLYYITQLGVAMSPLSNTAAASAYLENPFPTFFHRGLNVSLATNQPLFFHFTRDPLIEEYSIAAKLWKFEFNDLSEIARNSVRQSGFPPSWKQKAAGPLYTLRSTLGNDVRKSRVSDIRVAYRYEVYHNELNFLDRQLQNAQCVPRAMPRLEEEVAIYEAATKAMTDAGSILSDAGFYENKMAFIMPNAESGRALSAAERTALTKRELDRLGRELRRMTAMTQQVSSHNVSIATTINDIRERLKTEELVVLGNLDRPKAADAEDRVGGTAGVDSQS